MSDKYKIGLMINKDDKQFPKTIKELSVLIQQYERRIKLNKL